VGIVLFANVDHATLARVYGANPHDGIYFLGREHLSPEKLLKCLKKLATSPRSERHLAILRSRFTPESVVPRHFNPHQKIVRNTDARLTPLLLDIDQESWTKQRLRLSEDAAIVAEDAPDAEDAESSPATLVTGVAGSGKSLVLLFRAHAQARLDTGSRSLFVTHNKALGQELKSRHTDMGSARSLLWRTYLAWCHEHLAANCRIPKLVAYSARQRLIESAAQTIWPTLSAQWGLFLRDEYDWLQDHGLTTLEAYLAVERVGRRIGLAEDRRRQVFRAYQNYRAELRRRGLEDWSGLALRLWRKVEVGELQLPSYDYVYVDEAQFFAPIWLRTLRAALVPVSGRIFLAADPTQGFLKRRQSWSACGLDLRGRSTRLRRSYRNARAILEFAGNFYRARMDDEDAEELNLPDVAELASAPAEGSAQFLSVTSRQDEITRVLNEVRAYLNQGAPADAVLVLHASGRDTSELANRLRQSLGGENVQDARVAATPGKVRVCALDGATGLEAPIVFVVGTSELIEAESDLQLPPDQRAELVRDNTRRLYMAFTRAGVRLFVTWRGDPPPWAPVN
jgi:hypothetical protein